MYLLKIFLLAAIILALCSGFAALAMRYPVGMAWVIIAAMCLYFSKEIIDAHIRSKK